MSEKWICVCEMCWPKAVEYCELIPDHFLFENEGRWGLMCQPGHKSDHVMLWFPERPWPDPDPDTEVDEGPVADESCRWVDIVSDWWESLRLRPQDGHFLVEACLKAGFGESRSHPLLGHWLFHLAGLRLAPDPAHPG